MLAQTHLKQQLDALRHSTVSGFVRLRVAAHVDVFPWLVGGPDALPRIYWHARGQQSPEYVALGAIHELTRPEDIQRVCDPPARPVKTAPLLRGGLAFDPDLPGWQGLAPAASCCPASSWYAGECTSLCLNLWLPAREEGHAFEAEPCAAEAALDACNPRPPARPAKAAMAAPGPAGPCPVADPGGAGHGPDFQACTQRWCCPGEPHPGERGARCALCPWSLLTQWARHAQECFHTRLSVPPSRASSPAPRAPLPPGEGPPFTEALAGTIRRSGDEATDAALAAELLADSKNRLENRLVHADILSRLAPSRPMPP